MKILMRVTKGCAQLTSNDTHFFGSWLILVKTDKEEIVEGVDYCGPVKISHKGFYLATI